MGKQDTIEVLQARVVELIELKSWLTERCTKLNKDRAEIMGKYNSLHQDMEKLSKEYQISKAHIARLNDTNRESMYANDLLRQEREILQSKWEWAKATIVFAVLVGFTYAVALGIGWLVHHVSICLH